MGEVADMMLDGTLCEGCGVYIEGDAEGFPRYCSEACRNDRGATKERIAHAIAERPKVACPRCGKKVAMSGIAQHWESKHQ